MRGGARPNSGGARPGAGRKPSPVRKVQISLKLHPDTLAMLKARSAATGQPVNSIIESAILRHLHGD